MVASEQKRVSIQWERLKSEECNLSVKDFCWQKCSFCAQILCTFLLWKQNPPKSPILSKNFHFWLSSGKRNTKYKVSYFCQHFLTFRSLRKRKKKSLLFLSTNFHFWIGSHFFFFFCFKSLLYLSTNFVSCDGILTRFARSQTLIRALTADGCERTKASEYSMRQG